MAKHHKKKYSWIYIALLVFIIIALGDTAFYFVSYKDRVYPNISLAGVNIGGLTLQEANSIASERFSIPKSIALKFQDQSIEIQTQDIGFSYNFPESIQNAYQFTRTGNIAKDFYSRFDVIPHPKNINLSINIDEDKLQKIISVISGQISEEPIEPSVKLVNSQIMVDKGQPGREVDQNSLKTIIINNLSQHSFNTINIPVVTIDHSLNQTQADTLKSRAEKFVGKSLQAKFEFSTFTFSDTDILILLDPLSGYRDSAISNLIQTKVTGIERDPQNPKFVFTDGKVSEFQPALDGIKIDDEKFKEQLVSSLDTLAGSTDTSVNFDVPVLHKPPEITTDKINNLGIKELIGRGTSTFFHSIPGRVHNVVLAASRINGTLVKPGDTFSFNNTLGDVSAFTGYQQAYIISDGKTILGDGGGVCQVSTTLFRSLLNAGLPIIERAAHAYRVGYYEQSSPPGLDATVYGPSPDLKFTNDTQNYILIEATSDPKNYSLIFELYGTNDGRVATITKPTVTNVSPALPTVYQDDPTLPVGTLKQTDYSAAGATVKFNYTVTRSGQTIFQKTFVSNYHPWAAVYLRGTGPAI